MHLVVRTFARFAQLKKRLVSTLLWHFSVFNNTIKKHFSVFKSAAIGGILKIFWEYPWKWSLGYILESRFGLYNEGGVRPKAGEHHLGFGRSAGLCAGELLVVDEQRQSWWAVRRGQQTSGVALRWVRGLIRCKMGGGWVDRCWWVINTQTHQPTPSSFIGNSRSPLALWSSRGPGRHGFLRQRDGGGHGHLEGRNGTAAVGLRRISVK